MQNIFEAVIVSSEYKIKLTLHNVLMMTDEMTNVHFH